jgi:hypothetical protein
MTVAEYTSPLLDAPLGVDSHGAHRGEFVVEHDPDNTGSIMRFVGESRAAGEIGQDDSDAPRWEHHFDARAVTL